MHYLFACLFVCLSITIHVAECRVWSGIFGQNTGRYSGNVIGIRELTKKTVRVSGNVKRDTEFDRNTVRDSGNVIGIRDFTLTRASGFAKVCARVRDWERKGYSGWR